MTQTPISNMNNETNREKLTAALLLLAMVFNFSIGAAAQSSGGTFAITKSVIASGGTGNAQQSSGGTFALAGTIGQSIAGDSLTGGTFALNSGFWSPTVYNVGVEGDLTVRPGGNTTVESNDVVLIRRLVNGTASVDPEYNEFQRADSAPRNTFGDGSIDSADITQARRYQNQIDPSHAAAGPTEKTAAPRPASADDNQKSNKKIVQATDDYSSKQSAGTRLIRVESTSAIAGQTVIVNIRVDAAGDEAGYGFIINYDKTKLTNPVIGAGNAGAAVRACNLNFSTGINCAVDTFPDNNPSSADSSIGEIHAGDNQILISVTFNVAPNAPSALNLTLSGVNASNDNADSVPISGVNGTVTVSGGPTAAPVAVGGRIMTADGRGIRNVQVTMTDAGGNSRTVLSSVSGRFRFEEIAAGETYVLTVVAKRFVFAQSTQVHSFNEDTDDIIFVAEPAISTSNALTVPNLKLP